MMKEELRTFDGRLLLPERKAYTVDYALSSKERELYDDVTEYIRTEYDRAHRLQGGRRTSVGFALTILQRRLASSSEAIYQSLKTRRETLETRVEAWQALLDDLQDVLVDHDEVEDLRASDRELQEDVVTRSATAAQTPQELQIEIEVLRRLEALANDARQSNSDHKWQKLREIWQTDIPEMEMGDGKTRKLIIFTEWRATIDYLVRKLSELLGDPAAIVTIHGGMPMQQRRIAESRFRDDQRIQILVANDAAGEGINLQCAHLMVNYDLPWNPNRLEQRFGRIHRIGQTEVCHLWNLVSGETREGAVYKRLLEKIASQSKALNGKVFDVLGQLVQDAPLRKLMIDAVRFGDDPRRQREMVQAADNEIAQARVRQLAQDRMLVTENIDLSRLQTAMEESANRRLQAEDLLDFVARAFRLLPTGRISHSGGGFYRVGKVPGVIVQAAEQSGIRNLRAEYPRICFDRARMRDEIGSQRGEFVHMGHPLLQASVNWALQRWDRIRPECGERLLVLVDDSPSSADTTDVSLVYYAEWTIRNAVEAQSGGNVLSREACFIEAKRSGKISTLSSSPFSHLRSVTLEDFSKASPLLNEVLASNEELDEDVEDFAIDRLVDPSADLIREREDERINRERSEVMKNLDALIAEEERQEARFEYLAITHPENRRVYNASKAQFSDRRMRF